MEEEKTEKVNFNIAQALSYELILLRQKVNTFIVGGDLLGWFSTLKAMKMCAIASMDKSEREALKKLEAGVLEELSTMAQNKKGFEINDAYRSARGKASMKIEELDETLMDILQRHGFLMGIKADSTKLAGIS
jgi:hypothetical protein